MGYFPNSISNGTKGPRVGETLSVGTQQPGLRATYINTIAQISLPFGIHCRAGLYVQVGWVGGAAPGGCCGCGAAVEGRVVVYVKPA